MTGFDALRHARMIVAIVATCLPILFPLSACAQYGGRSTMVINDPADKQNIIGTIPLAQIWGQHLKFPQQYSRGLINLKEAVHRWTPIRVSMERKIYMNTSKFPSLPFAYVTTDESFELMQSEQENLRRFFDNGGFMVMETATPSIQNSQAEAALKSMLRSTLGSQVRFAPIGDDDALYHCFFDFDEGPPRGAEGGSSGRTINREVRYLEGIYYRGRLAGVFSAKGYIVKWNDLIGGDESSNPQLRMGVNFIVYALRNYKSGTPVPPR